MIAPRADSTQGKWQKYISLNAYNKAFGGLIPLPMKQCKLSGMEITQRHFISVNNSVAGRLAQWGKDSALSKVSAEKPDLVIIGFGMNDGTFKVLPEIYREQIKAMIDLTMSQNPQTEFILIAPMLANPLSGFDGFQFN